MGGFQQRQWTPTKRRGPIAAEFSGPGPAAVALPTLVGRLKPNIKLVVGNLVPESKRGRGPSFSFGARHNEKNDSAGPGPGQYNITGLSSKGKDTPLAATLHSRAKETRLDNYPAPGDYNLDKSEKVLHEHSPEYTFGLKTQTEKPNPNPAPNVYNIPTVMGAAKEGHFRAAPSFSISGRTKDFPDGRLLNPGPGAYNDAPIDLPPAHSFGIKHSPYSHSFGIGY